MALDTSAQSLPVTTGLKLWLKADAGITATGNGEVTAWADQSGSGNNAVQTDVAKAPTIEANSLNGKPTVRFGGGTRFLDVATSASISSLGDDVTVLVLVKYDDLGTYRACLSRTTGHSPAPFDWWNNEGVNVGRTSFYLGDGNDPNNRQFVSTAAPLVGLYNVMGFSWGGGNVSQYLNDLPNGAGTYTITPADAADPLPPSILRIGSRADLVTQLKGNLAEALIYQPALSDNDRTAVINYLATKWAISFNKPPTVAIQSPAPGSTSPVGSLALSINASDPDGTIKRVDLFNHGIPLASFTQPPYALTLAMLNPGTATFTALAVDNLDRTAASAPVSVTITGDAPAAPVTAGLKVWLRADAGVAADANSLVSAWADQSGSGNDASATDPSAAPLLVANAINNKPALRFGPNTFTDNQYLEVSDAGTAFTAADLSTFAIARFTNFASYRVLWTKSSSGRAAPIDWWFAPGSGVPNTFRGDGVNFGGPVTGLIAPGLGQFAAIGMAVAGQSVSHFLGFTENGSGNIANTTASAGTPLRIGRRDDGAVQMLGDIAEILLYDRALSATERSNVVNYLSSKYGLAQAIIGNQPPVAQVTTPANNASFAVGATTPFAVDASDSDGTVTRVDLVANGSVLVSLTNAPYQVSVEFLSPGPVTLSGIAVDNWGVRGTSAPVTLTVTGTGPAAPPTSGLSLWLKADDGPATNPDGTLSGWSDKSGNANNANPGFTAPLLVPNAVNGKPVVRFDGVDNFMEVNTAPSIAFAGDVSSFAVIKYEDFATYRALWAKTAGAGNNLPASVDYYALPGSGIPRFYRGNGGPSNGFVDGNRGLVAGSYMLIGFGMAGTSAAHYINGMTAGSGVITAALADGGTPLKIGTRGDLFTKLKGDLAELLIFGRALTEAERTQVQAYLAGKYGMALVRLFNLPPAVAVTSPAGGSTIAAPGMLTVSAQVTDTDSSITRVEFLADGVVVGSVTVPPYTIPLEVVTPGTLTLEARAIDFWGASTLSAPVTVTATGTGPAAPPASGLVLWLKADAGVSTNLDGTVTTWVDQSPLANNAAPADPGSSPVLVTDVKTGKPALQFIDSPKYLDIVSAPSIVLQGDISCFCGINVADFLELRTVWSKTTAGRAYPWNYYISGGNTVVVRGNTDGEQAIGSTGPVREGMPAAAGFTVEGALTTHYLNGRANGAGSMGFGALDQGSPLRIGLNDAMANPFKGTMSEILLYNRALSTSEIRLASTYLAARNGIAIVQMPSQPALTVTQVDAANIRISWPAAFTGFELEARTEFATGTWTTVATQNNQVTVGTTGSARFFRLRQQ
jgi:hypothetical protein